MSNLVGSNEIGWLSYQKSVQIHYLKPNNNSDLPITGHLSLSRSATLRASIEDPAATDAVAMVTRWPSGSPGGALTRHSSIVRDSRQISARDCHTQM